MVAELLASTRSRSGIWVVALLLSIPIAFPRSASAAWIGNGVRVSPFTSNQTALTLAPDGAGGAYLAWVDDRGGTYLHHLDVDGNAAVGFDPGGGPLFGATVDPMLIADGAGGVYAAAANPRFVSSAIYLTRVPGWPPGGIRIPAARGVPAPTMLDPESPTYVGQAPTIALDADGGPLIAWNHWPFSNFNYHIHATRFAANDSMMPGWGILGGTFWGSDPFTPSALCSDGAGGMFLAYLAVTDSERISVNHVAANGSPVFSMMVSSVSNRQEAPGLVYDGSGGTFVFWVDRAGSGAPHVQHLLADGSRAVGWPDDGISLSSHRTDAGTVRTAGGYWSRTLSSVASDGAGGAYVAWTDLRDTTAGDIHAQHILGDGVSPDWPVGGLAICSAPGDQRFPTVSEDGAGGLLVAWQDARSGSYDVYAQRVDASGSVTLAWPADGLAVCTADSTQELPRVAGDGVSGAVVAWVDHRDGMPQIYAARVTYDGAVPALASLISADATSERVRVEWYVSGSRGGAITIERQVEARGWRPFASVLPDASGRVVADDRDVVAGGAYQYRLALGDATYAGEVSIRVPFAPDLALSAPHPNPSKGDLSISWSLPDAGAARITIVDVAGRQVFSRDVGGLGKGPHALTLAGESRLAPGVYLVRLSRGQQHLARRVVVTR